MWRKFPIKKKEMYLTFFISTRFLLLLMISSPQHWQTWYLCGKKCLDIITRIFVILQMMKHLFWSAQTYLLLADERLNSSSTVLLNSTATDNVDFHLVVICSHSSEDIFLIGDTTVNCSSTDAAGNTDTCLLVVTVTGVNMIICYVEKCRRRSGSGFWKMWFLLKD